MKRPGAIVRYEQVYIASYALGLGATALTWQMRAAMLAANPVAAGAAWLMPASAALGLTIGVALWWFTARDPRVAAKWIVAALAVFSLFSLFMNGVALLTGHLASGVIVSAVSAALHVAAAAMLFGEEARAWFGEAPEIREDAA